MAIKDVQRGEGELKGKLARAGLVGACLGVVIVGLLENADRFSDPRALYHDARLEPAEVGQLSPSIAPRADRLTDQIID